MEDGEEITYGLEHIDRYEFRHFEICANMWYLPHKRKRIYFVGVLKEFCKPGTMDGIAATIKECCHKRKGHIDDCLYDVRTEHVKDVEQGSSAKRPRTTRCNFQIFDEVREKEGFQHRDSRCGQPFSRKLGKTKCQELGMRNCEILDITMLRELKQHGCMRPRVLVDLSQNIKRRVTTANGDMGTPTTSQMLFDMDAKKFLQCEDIFQAMGWPAQLLEVSALSKSQWQRLTGNMMVLPCVGVCMAAILKHVVFHSDTNFSRAKK